MAKFQYAEFENEAVEPYRIQTPLHLHDRDGRGPALAEDNGDSPWSDFSYSPGGWNWTPYQPGSYPSNGRRGRDGKDGLKGLPGKSALKSTPGSIDITVQNLAFYLNKMFNGGGGSPSTSGFLSGILRFSPGTTLLQQWNGAAWADVTFLGTDPGGGEIWASDV